MDEDKSERMGSLDALQAASRDLRESARLFGQSEARYLVDLYYVVQGARMRAAAQGRASEEVTEPTNMVEWTFESFRLIENSIKPALGRYAAAQPAGSWALGVVGIGPVLAAGVLAHLDITRAPTAGHFWSFAGLDPSKTWKKGEKRPWNARLKVLCWKIGDSFVKQSGHEKCFYGHYYRTRKAIEVARNERGDYVAIAARTLAEKKFKDKETREAYEAGRLPAGRIDLRARRWAVKLFLAHLHYVLHVTHFGAPPPRPYVLEHGSREHVHYIPVPDFE